MRSPSEMKSLLIDITNACDKRCSNCTRFCGNHKKPFFMDYETFARAVDSLTEHNGTVGIMGGEPTLHPQFERFMLCLREKLGVHPDRGRLLYPIKDFVKENLRRDWECSRVTDDKGELKYKEYGARLFSNMGASYRKHYEIIADTCNKQVLDDHINPVYHQPGLVARKDLGIPDDEWAKIRDSCWIQAEWCASITPKGAFFCEIAAGLDMLFDGPGGWPIEPGWWNRTPEDVGEQLRWCELCGFALNTFTRIHSEETDDVSATPYALLEKAGGHKIRTGRINLLKIEDGKIAEESKRSDKRFTSGMPYLEHYEDRFSAANSVLFPKSFEIAATEDGERFGRELNGLIGKTDEWLAVKLPHAVLPEGFPDNLKGYVLNPGTLIYGEGYALFSKNALSLREIGFDRIAAMRSIGDLKSGWNREKLIEYSPDLGIPKPVKSNIKQDRSYAVWGAGMAGDQAIDAIECAKAKISLVVDRAKSKQGGMFHGFVISAPEKLLESEFDYVICANYNHAEEIREQTVSLGTDPKKVLLISEI
jgi:hypothetical protein